MNQNSPQDPHDSSGDQPVPAPRYGQYIPNPAQAAQKNVPLKRRDAMGRAARRRKAGRGSRVRPHMMTVTWSIMGLCVGTWVLQWALALTTHLDLAWTLGYMPVLTSIEPWRMLTSGFVHSIPSPLHLLLNMYTLYLFGRMLEPALGGWRMAVLFVLSVLGGSLGVLVLQAPPTVLVIGASGGIFGLFGALFVFLRHFKRDLRPLVVLIAINLAFGFLVDGIAWQAHVGGLLTGALVALVMMPGLRGRR